MNALKGLSLQLFNIVSGSFDPDVAKYNVCLIFGAIVLEVSSTHYRAGFQSTKNFKLV